MIICFPENNSQGFIRQIRSKWGSDVHFRHIILDYSFCPVGWARERWPAIASNFLTPGGKLWLPSLQNVTDAIELNLERIATLFAVQKFSNPMQNPLYAASENCTEELLRCSVPFTNENQIIPLFSASQFPFMHWDH